MDSLHPVLAEMYATRRAPGVDGQVRDVRAEVTPEHAAALKRVVLERRPELVVEIGMACGLSSLAILDGLLEVGRGTLISIDPYQHEWFHGVGVAALRRAGFADRHELIEEPSFLALPRLLEAGRRVDLAYQDAMHEFGFQLVDVFYLGRLLRVGGLLGLNDCQLPGVRRTCSYLLSRPDFAERPVVPRSYQGRNAVFTLGRWLLRRPVNDRYFEKVADWEPPYDYYRRF